MSTLSRKSRMVFPELFDIQKHNRNRFNIMVKQDGVKHMTLENIILEELK